MSEPVHMVFINVIASLILLFGVLFYRFVYPKKKINLFVLLLLVSILPIISIFRPGDYESGDFNIHIYRIMNFYDLLKVGNFMPSWANELNASYGNPLFIFNYSLPYYVISFIHFLGLSFISSMKAYLGIVMYLSGIFMYLFVNKLTNNKIAAFTASIFYIFNPYHLIDVHFRATLGESTIFAITPLLFLFIVSYLKNKKYIYLISVSIVTALLTMAHPLLSVIFCAIATLYIASQTLTKNDIRSFLKTMIALLIGGIASMYIWLPFIIFSPYTFPNPSITISFYPFTQLLYSSFRYGFLFQGPKGELALIIGYTQLLVVLISIILLIKNKIIYKIRNDYIFWLSLFIFLFFLISPLSTTFWNLLPLFWMLIPFGRLLLPTAFTTSILAGYLILHLKKKELMIYFLILITIGYTILNWGQRRVIPQINDTVLRKNVWISTFASEGTTAYFLNNKWADINNFWFSKLPNKHLEIINGVGTIKEIKRTSTEHDYIVNAKTALVIRESTLYFPGWSLTSNNKLVSIYPGKRGIINAKLSKGSQNVTLSYEDISLYKTSKTISVLTFSGLLLILILSILWHGRFSRYPKHLSR
jgi:hypothetical protein